MIPNPLDYIGEYAFYNCSGLYQIQLSSNATNIPNYVFYNCSNLYDITIPESVTEI